MFSANSRVTSPPGLRDVEMLLSCQLSSASECETDPFFRKILLGRIRDLSAGALIYSSHGPGNKACRGSDVCEIPLLVGTIDAIWVANALYPSRT